MAAFAKELSAINKELEAFGQLSDTELTLLRSHYKNKLEMIDMVLGKLHVSPIVDSHLSREVVGAAAK